MPPYWLYAQALGPLLQDELFRGAVFGLAHPATMGALRDGGLSREKAAELISDILDGMADRAARARRSR